MSLPPLRCVNSFLMVKFVVFVAGLVPLSSWIGLGAAPPLAAASGAVPPGVALAVGWLVAWSTESVGSAKCGASVIAAGGIEEGAKKVWAIGGTCGCPAGPCASAAAAARNTLRMLAHRAIMT